MGEAERIDPERRAEFLASRGAEQAHHESNLSDHLMSLFQRLPDEDKGALIHLAEHLARKADPVAWSLDNAPLDDEPTTEADLKAIAEAEAELAAGEPTITLEELEAELGL